MSTSKFAFNPSEYRSDKLGLYGAPMAMVGAAAAIGFLVHGAISSNAIAEGDGVGRDSKAYVAELTISERFEHDYAGYEDSGDDCLSPTGYDLFDAGHNQLVSVGRISVDGDIVTVTPGEPNKHADPIELVLDNGPDKGERPLQPANAESAEVLAVHGCKVSSY